MEAAPHVALEGERALCDRCSTSLANMHVACEGCGWDVCLQVRGGRWAVGRGPVDCKLFCARRQRLPEPFHLPFTSATVKSGTLQKEQVLNSKLAVPTRCLPRCRPPA